PVENVEKQQRKVPEQSHSSPVSRFSVGSGRVAFKIVQTCIKFLNSNFSDFMCESKPMFGVQTLGFGNFSLLGWSDGGITALIAAATNPELIKKMVVWGSNAFVSEEDLKLYNMVRDVSRWSARMRQPMEVYGSQVFAQTWEAWVDGITQFAKRPGGSICREQLPFISCPTLIVHGEKDPMVPSFHPQYLLKHSKDPGKRRPLKGKHNLHLRYADEFNKLVENFLEE
uniref:AB hydrolase-1 domain-containing protein n=1 Tax=Oryzias melastigma TaxID=30732 RepID=A0A3B3DID4_ORYME